MSDESHVPHGAPAPDYTGPRRSLILAGGGMRVAWQAGVIRALFESGLVFAHADGTSGGTFNLAMLLSGLSPIEMCERWTRLKVGDFVSFMPLTEYLKGTHIEALGDADGIIKHVFPGLGIDVGRIRAARGIEGTFNVCNFTDKTNEAIPHADVDLDLLVAGISLPIFMPAVARGSTLYVDSVWIRDANLMEAVRRGCEELWVVWCIGNTPEYVAGPFHQYVHMIELSANGGLFEDLDRIDELNRMIEAGHSPYGQTGPIRVHVVKPDIALPLDPDFYAGRIDAETLVGLGFRDAHRYLARMPKDGLPLTRDVTKMRTRGVGVSFTETLKGPLALHETDAAAGARRGERDGTQMIFHGNIDIEDLDRFIEDPKHAGSLVGEVSVNGLGDRMPLSDGLFNLFAPEPGQDARVVLYQGTFEHDGTTYCVAGRSDLRDDPGMDIWKDLTSVPVTLHQGAGPDGPVTGAGILRIGADELRKIVTSTRVTNAGSIVDRAAAAQRFGRFFARQLWDEYHGG